MAKLQEVQCETKVFWNKQASRQPRQQASKDNSPLAPALINVKEWPSRPWLKSSEGRKKSRLSIHKKEWRNKEGGLAGGSRPSTPQHPIINALPMSPFLPIFTWRAGKYTRKSDVTSGGGAQGSRACPLCISSPLCGREDEKFPFCPPPKSW